MLRTKVPPDVRETRLDFLEKNAPQRSFGMELNNTMAGYTKPAVSGSRRKLNFPDLDKGPKKAKTDNQENKQTSPLPMAQPMADDSKLVSEKAMEDQQLPVSLAAAMEDDPSQQKKWPLAEEGKINLRIQVENNKSLPSPEIKSPPQIKRDQEYRKTLFQTPSPMETTLSGKGPSFFTFIGAAQPRPYLTEEALKAEHSLIESRVVLSANHPEFAFKRYQAAVRNNSMRLEQEMGMALQESPRFGSRR